MKPLPKVPTVSGPNWMVSLPTRNVPETLYLTETFTTAGFSSMVRFSPVLSRDPPKPGAANRAAARQAQAPAKRVFSNSRKTERGAKQLLQRLVVRVTPFALITYSLRSE